MKLFKLIIFSLVVVFSQQGCSIFLFGGEGGVAHYYQDGEGPGDSMPG